MTHLIPAEQNTNQSNSGLINWCAKRVKKLPNLSFAIGWFTTYLFRPGAKTFAHEKQNGLAVFARRAFNLEKTARN
jgi:hypothetical protein